MTQWITFSKPGASITHNATLPLSDTELSVTLLFLSPVHDCYHGEVPCLDDVDVSHQILPGQQALHVHEHRLPHRLQPLQVSIQPGEED